MLTEETFLKAREEIHKLQKAQDEIYEKIYSKFPEKTKDQFPELRHMLEDFLYNNIYYTGKDINRFLNELYMKEVLLEI